jgi:hypothetical protein
MLKIAPVFLLRKTNIKYVSRTNKVLWTFYRMTLSKLPGLVGSTLSVFLDLASSLRHVKTLRVILDCLWSDVGPLVDIIWHLFQCVRIVCRSSSWKLGNTWSRFLDAWKDAGIFRLDSVGLSSSCFSTALFRTQMRITWGLYVFIYCCLSWTRLLYDVSWFLYGLCMILYYLYTTFIWCLHECCILCM